MAILRNDLFAAVRRYLNRPNLPEEELIQVMYATEGELNRLLAKHPRNRVIAEFEIQEGSDARLPLPDDLVNIVEIQNVTANKPYRQRPINLAPVDWTYADRGSTLELTPLPAVGAKIWLDYHAMIPQLDEGTKSNWVSNHHADLYVYGMLKEFALVLKQDQRLKLWSAEFNRRIDDIQRQGWNQNIAAGPKMRSVA